MVYGPVPSKRDPEDNISKTIRIVSWSLAGILCAVVLVSSFFIVAPGERGLIFNTITGLKPTIYGEGMHLKIPLLEHTINMNIRVQRQSEEATAASKDLQDARTQVAVNYVVEQDKLVEIYRTIGSSTDEQDYMQTEIMNPIIQESIKGVTAEYTADELITKRPQVKQEIDQRIKERLEAYHINVVDVSITDFKFSDVFAQAIEAKVTAEQNALKEENNLRVVKFQADQKIEQARGDAESIRIVNEQLVRSPEYVNYYLLQKWDGHMPLALGSQTILSLANQSG
jgi:regulator of protease activity HflC (stomatin/prohibitin superfamily)